jgi:uncharacterized protein YcbX
VSFADGYPYLLVSEASLDVLNARLANKGEPEKDMCRFRHNMVVKGVPAFDEDCWRIIRIGEVIFFVVKPCMRGTIDAAGADVQPLAELAQFRRRKDDKVFFGQNLVAANSGLVRPGDTVFVIERGLANVTFDQ